MIWHSKPEAVFINNQAIRGLSSALIPRQVLLACLNDERQIW